MNSVPENSITLMDFLSTVNMIFMISEAVFCPRDIFVFDQRRTFIRLILLLIRGGLYTLDILVGQRRSFMRLIAGCQVS